MGKANVNGLLYWFPGYCMMKYCTAGGFEGADLSQGRCNGKVLIILTNRHINNVYFSTMDSYHTYV